MSVARTNEIRPGHVFNVMVTEDLLVPGTLRRRGARMKLRPIQTQPAAELKKRVPGELHRALTAYASYDRETTGRTIEPWPLIVQFLHQFLDADLDFQAWRRRTRNRSGEGSTMS
jgi:hypothetical protein